MEGSKAAARVVVVGDSHDLRDQSETSPTIVLASGCTRRKWWRDGEQGLGDESSTITMSCHYYSPSEVSSRYLV